MATHTRERVRRRKSVEPEKQRNVTLSDYVKKYHCQHNVTDHEDKD
jgi:hypothetical protein